MTAIDQLRRKLVQQQRRHNTLLASQKQHRMLGQQASWAAEVARSQQRIEELKHQIEKTEAL